MKLKRISQLGFLSIKSDKLLIILLWVLVCSALWGSAFPGIKYVYHQYGDVSHAFKYAFAGVRFVIAGLLIFVIYHKDLLKLASSPIPWKPLCLLILFQTILQYVFFYEGMALSSGVLGSVLIGFGSIWWMVLAPLFLKIDWPTWRPWVGIIMSLIGAAIAVYSPEVGNGNPVVGGGLFLLASLSGAGAAITIKFFPKTFSIPLATGISLFVGGLVLLAFGYSETPKVIAAENKWVLGMTVWLAFVSAAAFSIWNSLIQNHPIHLLAQFRFLIPLSGVFQSILFIPDESLRLHTIVGGGIVIFSIWWISWTQNR